LTFLTISEPFYGIPKTKNVGLYQVGVLKVNFEFDNPLLETMRTLLNLTFAFFLLITAASANNQIDLRLTPAAIDIDQRTLFVNVEIRYNERGSINLGGQNYRFFYDSELLKLNVDGSESVLPTTKYTDLTLVEHMEGINADEVGQLNFDDALGYVNFSIDLLKNNEGGIQVHGGKDAWFTVATLHFELNSTDDMAEIVWGREGMSDGYATAFVEVSEWIQPYVMRALDVNNYKDASIDLTTSLEESVSLSIGPNPTSDFVNVAMNRPVASAADVLIRDITGKVVRQRTIDEGMKEVKLNVHDLTSANYLLEIHMPEDGKVHKEIIVIAK
jgi:hypothetical protein